MPALLTDAYGSVFAKDMQRNNVAILKRAAQTAAPSSLGAPLTVPETSDAIVRARFTAGAAKNNGNYHIHITIDREDCHLLCLFIGVFTLSVLFNSNKRGPPPS